MPDNEKANDLLKELEIQSILDERHRIADEEKMQKTAQKYRAKPKVEEIFSNADKKPRLKNENPLEVADKQKQPDVSNTIVGEKTAATMKTELMMDGREGGETLKTPEEAGGPLNQFGTVGVYFETGGGVLYEERLLRVECGGFYSNVDEDADIA